MNNTLINMYCESVIHTIEKQIHKLEREAYKDKNPTEIEKEYLEKYDDLLFEKYCNLEKLLEEEDQL